MLRRLTILITTLGSLAATLATSSPARAMPTVPVYTDGSVLATLHRIVTIGSTVDPLNGDVNPYGLDVARATHPPLAAGDLVICNFNDSGNVQGTGTTIVALHPVPGATPLHIAGAPSLLGCNALALGPTDNIWAAAFAANDNPIVTPGGVVATTLPGGPWRHPFGEIFAWRAAPGSLGAFYESNAADGTIVRITIFPGPKFVYEIIARGFAVNGGAPGSILGPSGLQYDARRDRLFIVDGASNSVVVFERVSRIPAGGIDVRGAGFFSGAYASLARLVYAGAPLNGPISSALLPGGHLVVGNTLDPNGQNLMVELGPNGRLLDVVNVDTGAAGAIFGMVATGSFDFDTKLYFNDDNANALEVLTR
ncbi:MAG TPA: hypothetical protein VKG44_00235 [Candidatus Baltobacteraceae bacterium]|nr:hypothetical protein [Candidatus Baltobacteraceae bacterium]